MKALKLKSSPDSDPEWLLAENQTMFPWHYPTLFHGSETFESVLNMSGSYYEEFIQNYEWVTVDIIIKR